MRWFSERSVLRSSYSSSCRARGDRFGLVDPGTGVNQTGVNHRHAEWFIALGTAVIVVSLAAAIGPAGLAGLAVLASVIALTLVVDRI